MSLDNLNGQDVCGFNYLFGYCLGAFKANYGGYKYIFTVRQVHILAEVTYMMWKKLLAIKIILPPLNSWRFIAEVNVTTVYAGWI